MGCRRSVPPVSIFRIILAVAILSSLSLVALPRGVAPAEEGTPVRRGSPSSAKEQQGGLADAGALVAKRLAATFPRIEGLIIGFEGDLVVIDRGAAAGIFQGMELDVFREGQEFKHPLTGESLGKLDKDLGMIRILHVRERYAEATVVKKTEKTGFRKGDRVRVSMARMIVAFPNVDVEGVSGVSARTITRELATALAHTGRFELIEERQLRSILLADKSLSARELADPLILRQLADRGKVQILLLSRLTPTADGVSLDVQGYSTLTGSPIVLISAPLEPGFATYDPPPRRPGPPLSAQPVAKSPPETGQPAAASPAASGRPAIASAPSEHVVLEPTFDGAMTAMAIGDLDGDGKSELYVAGADRLLSFRVDGYNLRPLAEYPLNGKGTVVMLEAIDVTGDKGAEIIMTLSHNGRYHALVVQWADSKLKEIWEAPDLIIRTLSSDGKTSQLFGQAAVAGDQLPRAIYRYEWNGREFRSGAALDGPAGLSLLELVMADLSGDGAVSPVTLQGGAALEVRSRTGKPIAAYQARRGSTTTSSRAGLRLLIEKERDGAGPLLILGREEAADARLFGRWAGSKAVNLVALKWDGAAFREVWQAPIIEGTLADYAVADLGGGLGRRLLALVVKRGRLGLGKRSEIEAYRLQ